MLIIYMFYKYVSYKFISFTVCHTSHMNDMLHSYILRLKNHLRFEYLKVEN